MYFALFVNLDGIEFFYKYFILKLNRKPFPVKENETINDNFIKLEFS